MIESDKIMNPEHFKISQEHEKMIQELKYLLTLDLNLYKSDVLKLLNKVQPFIQYPLESVPPIQMFEINQLGIKTITQDLKKQLQSYCFIILRGSMVISRESIQFSEEKYLDDENIRQKCVYNFYEGKSLMKGVTGTVYLKIHNLWIKKAKKRSQQRQKQYIKYKLIAIEFFSQISFEEFNQCCQKAYIKKLGPNEILMEENQTPYHMYVVAEGELSLQTKVKFSNQKNLWNEVKTQMKKNTQLGEQLFQYLVRQPQPMDSYFQIDFSLKQIHQGQIIGGRQTLLEKPLMYTIRSTMPTKIICIKYPDLYVLKQERLMEIRNWPFLCEINKKQLRKQYYSLMTWQDFKQFLKEENRLAKVQKTKFDFYLRKNVNLNAKKHNYFPQKVGQGTIIESPAGKVLKLKNLIKSPDKYSSQIVKKNTI